MPELRASTGAALRADRGRAGAARAGCPRAGGGRAGEPDLRADRVLLAGHDDARRGAGWTTPPSRRTPGRRCSARACGSSIVGGHAGDVAQRAGGGDPRRRADRRARRARRRRLAAHRRPRRARLARPAGVTGRKADTIVSGGENVAPAEVEAVLEAHPDVLEAAVVARADERWGEAVTAIVVTRPGAVLEGESLRAHCARGLAAHKVPKQVSFADEPLPRTRSGKLLRKELFQIGGEAVSGSARSAQRSVRDELRPERPPRREPAELGRGGVRLDAPAGGDARVQRPGLALDDRRDRAAAGRARARTGGGPRRDGHAGGGAGRADGGGDRLRPGRGDARAAPASGRSRWA